MNKVITAKACGKFILLGEHFIVTAASPALAFPVCELFCEVNVEEAPHNSFEAPCAYTIGQEKEVKSRMEASLNTVLRFIKKEGFTFKLASNTNIPIQKGFGSSAAFSVALCRAITSYFGEDYGVLGNAIDAVESLFHKTPSGIDTTTILHQKPIRFEKGVGAKEIYNQACDFILLDGGMRQDTASMIAHVKSIRENNQKLWESLSLRMKNIIEIAEHALHHGDVDDVVDSVREAQDILASLGLSNDKINSYIKESMNEGALVGKVSGAGGGGAIVLVTRRGEAHPIASRLKIRKLPVVATVSALSEDE